MSAGSNIMIGVMNKTKWDELRLAMHRLSEPSRRVYRLVVDRSPQWRTKDRKNGYVSEWDGDWFYHFYGGYERIEWVELRIVTPEQREMVRDCLRTVHVPGIETDDGFRVFGWVKSGEQVGYIE